MAFVNVNLKFLVYEKRRKMLLKHFLLFLGYIYPRLVCPENVMTTKLLSFGYEDRLEVDVIYNATNTSYQNLFRVFLTAAIYSVGVLDIACPSVCRKAVKPLGIEFIAELERKSGLLKGLVAIGHIIVPLIKEFAKNRIT